jgi:hypothetical protein
MWTPCNWVDIAGEERLVAKDLGDFPYLTVARGGPMFFHHSF